MHIYTYLFLFCPDAQKKNAEIPQRPHYTKLKRNAPSPSSSSPTSYPALGNKSQRIKKQEKEEGEEELEPDE